LNKLAFLLIAVTLLSCKEETPTPKPQGYFRIDLPAAKYREKEPEYCPIKFPLSENGRIEYTSSTTDPKCWFNLSYTSLDAKIYFTYKEVDGNLRELIEESRTLTYEHQAKANRIREKIISDTSRSVYGLVYDLGGAVASPVQLYLTDSTSHFLRGSLYFNARPNPDSIDPVLEFIKQDIDRFVEKLEWKD
jgi:gliding motility-associated lipoprotein GldD